MIKIRRSEERGDADHGWLHSKHTFSFAGYHDPSHMGFRSLRVINEDRIDGGTGFGAHPHRDMEIISYVVNGALAHRDSEGNIAVIRPNEVQRMSAGSGVTHSEQNESKTEGTHFFQIWVLPQTRGGRPGYAQKSFASALDAGGKVLVISGDGRDGSLPIKQDADIYIARLTPGQSVEHSIRPKRGVWLQIIKGALKISGLDTPLRAGDAVAVENEILLAAEALEQAEIMIFDLGEI